MKTGYVYEREGEPRELAIWDQRHTIHKRGDPFVFCLREQCPGGLNVEAVYPGSDVAHVMSHRAKDGELLPSDIFVSHDELVYTHCDVTETKRREHRPDLCAAAIEKAEAARREMEKHFAPPKFDWARHDLTPAFCQEKLEIGMDVRLARDAVQDIIATPVDQRMDPGLPYGAVVVTRDSMDGELLDTGRVVKCTETYRAAEHSAVEITNRIWLEQARDKSLERSR